MWLTFCICYGPQVKRTEVLQQEEATSIKPVPEGTEIPLRTINSTQHNQDTANPIHETMNGMQLSLFPRGFELRALSVSLLAKKLSVVDSNINKFILRKINNSPSNAAITRTYCIGWPFKCSKILKLK